jgi:hypothetical protein
MTSSRIFEQEISGRTVAELNTDFWILKVLISHRTCKSMVFDLIVRLNCGIVVIANVDDSCCRHLIRLINPGNKAAVCSSHRRPMEERSCFDN